MQQLASVAVTNKAAVGGYFKGLRERQYDTQDKFLAALGKQMGRVIDTTTIWRVETGRSIPGGDLLVEMLDLLHGSADDVIALQRDENADAAKGEALAEQRLLLSRGDQRYIRAALDAMPSDQRERLQAILGNLTPEQVEEWLRFGRFLGDDPTRKRA